MSCVLEKMCPCTCARVHVSYTGASTSICIVKSSHQRGYLSMLGGNVSLGETRVKAAKL
jgi:hypothetical protein